MERATSVHNERADAIAAIRAQDMANAAKSDPVSLNAYIARKVERYVAAN